MFRVFVLPLCTVYEYACLRFFAMFTNEGVNSIKTKAFCGENFVIISSESLVVVQTDLSRIRDDYKFLFERAFRGTVDPGGLELRGLRCGYALECRRRTASNTRPRDQTMTIRSRRLQFPEQLRKFESFSINRTNFFPFFRFFFFILG